MLVGLPFIVWVMVPFFESIPRKLTEAAVVDGASSVRLCECGAAAERAGHRHRADPLVRLLGTTSCSPSCWRRAGRTVPVAIYNFISYAQIDWGGLMAARSITLPVLVLAIITQRYVIRGLTAGAIKG